VPEPYWYRDRMAVEEHERRRPLLIAALGFAMLETRPEPPALTTLKDWLASWAGIGAIIAGMTRQGFNVEVCQFPEGWRVNFYSVGLAHSVVMGRPGRRHRAAQCSGRRGKR
jgi:hypothetical protein